MGTLTEYGVYGDQGPISNLLKPPLRRSSTERLRSLVAEVVRGMSLPTGRGDQRVRNCGLVRKWDNAWRQVERFEVLGACIMGVSQPCSETLSVFIIRPTA
jgi:hypothetical protein